MHRSIGGLLVIGLVLAGAGCGDDGGDASGAVEPSLPAKATVEISNSRYHPAKTVIRVGGDVTWVNQDTKKLHTAETAGTSNPPDPLAEAMFFDTHTITWHERYTVVFHKPGIYDYHCAFHPQMKGTVEVLIQQPVG